MQGFCLVVLGSPIQVQAAPCTATAEQRHGQHRVHPDGGGRLVEGGRPHLVDAGRGDDLPGVDGVERRPFRQRVLRTRQASSGGSLAWTNRVAASASSSITPTPSTGEDRLATSHNRRGRSSIWKFCVEISASSPTAQVRSSTLITNPVLVTVAVSGRPTNPQRQHIISRRLFRHPVVLRQDHEICGTVPPIDVVKHPYTIKDAQSRCSDGKRAPLRVHRATGRPPHGRRTPRRTNGDHQIALNW
jgi:hypothetical protein